MSLPAPEATLLADGEALATNGLSALSTGIAAWFAGDIAAVPKISADLIPAVTSAITNLAPENAAPYLGMIFGIADTAVAAAMPAVDASVIFGIKLAAANVAAAIAHLKTEV